MDQSHKYNRGGEVIEDICKLYKNKSYRRICIVSYQLDEVTHAKEYHQLLKIQKYILALEETTLSSGQWMPLERREKDRVRKGCTVDL